MPDPLTGEDLVAPPSQMNSTRLLEILNASSKAQVAQQEVARLIREEAYERGVADGLRQARQRLLDRAVRQEAIAAEAGVASAFAGGLRTAADILNEPAGQVDPLADDPVAGRLGLVDANGEALCRCLAGAPDCTHRPAEQDGADR